MNRTYFSINVTNRCNKACAYCINKDYINKAEYPDVMNFGDLKSWLDKEIKEDDIAEIAGTGEPTLCEWLPDLLGYLEDKKAWTMLRTNGFRLGEWRKSLDRLLVILSRHDSDDDYISEKCKYLLPNDLILNEVSKNLQNKNNIASNFENDVLSPSKWHDTERAFFVTPDGKVRFMPCVDKDMGTVWDYTPESWLCSNFKRCAFVLGAFNLISYLKAPFDLPAGYTHVQVGKLPPSRAAIVKVPLV